MRALLSWETKIATQKTVEEMERIIAEDIDHVLQYLNPVWFRLVLENRKLVEVQTTVFNYMSINQ